MKGIIRDLKFSLQAHNPLELSLQAHNPLKLSLQAHNPLELSLQAHNPKSCARSDSFEICVFALCLVLLFCVGCSKPSLETEAPAIQETSSAPSHLVRCYSTVDGRELTARVFFPATYDNAHQKPLIVVTPGTPFPDSLTLGEAIVARMDALRPSTCPDSLYLAECRSLTEHLLHNLAVNPTQIFLAGSTEQDLLFACQYAPLFAGAYFDLEAFDSLDLADIPLRNLRNLPVYLDNVTTPESLELEEHLKTSGNQLLCARKNILSAGDKTAALSSAFEWLVEKGTVQHHDIVWEWDTAQPSTAWWLRVESRQNPDKPGIISAHKETTPKGWCLIQLDTRNLQTLSIQTDAFPKTHPILLEIDGAKLGIQPGKDWMAFQRGQNGIWEPQALNKNANNAESLPAGFGALFRKPILFVVGTSATQDRNAFWRQTAQDAAVAWQTATGIAPLLKTDDEIDAKDLDERNVLIFGSPADNNFAAMTLTEEPMFLKRLFHTLEEEQRTDEDLTAITLCPAENLAQGTVVACVLVNGDKAIPDAWKPLLEKSTEPKDYIFRSPTLRKSGCFNPDWTLP